MEKSGFEVQRSDLLHFLDGHRYAGELIIRERKKRLQQLTHQESLNEYDSLCRIWEENLSKEGIEMLERKRIFFLLERRRTMDKLGGGFGGGR